MISPFVFVHLSLSLFLLNYFFFFCLSCLKRGEGLSQSPLLRPSTWSLLLSLNSCILFIWFRFKLSLNKSIFFIPCGSSLLLDLWQSLHRRGGCWLHKKLPPAIHKWALVIHLFLTMHRKVHSLLLMSM